MFGFFKSKEEKVQLKLLKELEEAGAPYAEYPSARRRHAHLVHVLRGGPDALPYYEAIAADYPECRRSAMLAAGIRLEYGDADGLATMEEVAQARPSLAIPAYRAIFDYHRQAGNEVDAKRAAQRLVEADQAEDAAAQEHRFVDPGGPLVPHAFNEKDLEFIRFWVERWLGGVPGITLLLAGSRTLDDGCSQPVLWADVAPEANSRDGLERLAELAAIYGDFLLFVNSDGMEWLREELARLPGSQLYP